jgi:hypothetical protein
VVKASVRQDGAPTLSGAAAAGKGKMISQAGTSFLQVWPEPAIVGLDQKGQELVGRSRSKALVFTLR